MIRKAKSALSFVLAAMLVISCIAFSGFSVSAESTRTVYVLNNVGWKELYCFMWDNSGSNANWPGKKMELLDDTVWSYEINNDYSNIIFNNGRSGGKNQTTDLVLPEAADYIYDIANDKWSMYNSEKAPVIVCDKISGYQFKKTATVNITAYYAENSYYTVNDGEPAEFADTASVVLGDDSDSEKTYTVKVHSENSYGTSDECFVFSKVNATLNEVELTAAPEYADKDSLYAHAAVEAASAQTWQKWETQSGPSSESGVYYFFLPPVASDSEVEIYNTFSSSVIINGVEIKPFTSAIISYTLGEKTMVSVENSSASAYLEIYKSDSEVSLFVNDTTGQYTDSNGHTVTDFYSFLTANKENAVNGSYCTIIDENGVNDTTLKKIKGRGNSTWYSAHKKPFNITFNSKTNIGGITSKKFCLLANAKDGTLLRNRIMYDLADEVGSSYSSDSRTLDLYINGSYKGAYQITQKVELGKNSLVSLKDESDTLTEDFNFLIELDIWNYAGDVYFVSDRGLPIVFNTPELEDYDGTNEVQNAQYEFMRSKYQQLEDALYSGNMSDLEQICDVESLARAYLLQEFGKNCDGGMTSCYFTYVAADGKFIADPIWDCDSTLGNVYAQRQNATNTAFTSGWAIRTAQYDETDMTNVLGQAFNAGGTTADNETFEEVVKRLWNDDFLPAIAVLKGEAEAQGTRLKSVEEYAAIAPNASSNNYVKWDFEWFPYHEALGGKYTYDLEGQIAYMSDWLAKRAEWISNELSGVYQDHYYLTGIGFGGWGAKTYELEKSATGTYCIDVTLKKDTEYNFKIFDGASAYFTANLKDEITAKYISCEGVNRNATITPTEDMNVTFIFNCSSFIIRVQEDALILGDVDGSGDITIDDATLVQKYIAELDTLTEAQLAAADADRDNSITISDATIIQKYVAEMISEF